MLELEGYPREEMEQWLNNPITRAFKDSLKGLRQEIMEQYKTNVLLEVYLNHRGKELMLIDIIGRLEGGQS